MTADNNSEQEPAPTIPKVEEPTWVQDLRAEFHARVTEPKTAAQHTLAALTAWDKNIQEQNAICDQLIRRMFDYLANHHISSVTMEFEGAGDSGQIESLFAPEDNWTDLMDRPWNVLPGEERVIASTVVIDPVTHEQTLSSNTVSMVLEGIAYNLIDREHSGWENNDGAYGVITMKVESKEIVLDHNERVTNVDNTLHEWQF